MHFNFTTKKKVRSYEMKRREYGDLHKKAYIRSLAHRIATSSSENAITVTNHTTVRPPVAEKQMTVTRNWQVVINHHQLI